VSGPISPKQFPIAPSVYLKHLIFDEEIAVADPTTHRAIYFSEDEVLEFIAQHKIAPVWPRKKRGLIRGLNWIGPPLKAQTNGTMTVEQDEAGPDMHSSAPYSNRHASDNNVENVWTHAGRATVLGHAFIAVLAASGARILKQKAARRKRRSWPENALNRPPPLNVSMTGKSAS
jgi:hypothetical protein